MTIRYIQVGDINELTDWQQALAGVDTVVHLAGRAHVMDSRWSLPCAWIPAFAGMTRVAGMTRGGNDELLTFRKVNVYGTERLARMAVKAGVKRFIFISSVKAEGNDAYGVSKREAEDSLACIAKETGLEIVILRLPLVYGPGVKANFRNLIKLASSGLPLPFKGINNRRSFIYLGNLVDAILTCISHPLAAGETFMVSDGQDVSTPDLIKMIAGAMNKKAVLFSLHPVILKALCRIVGKSAELEKLTGSLLVDSSKIRDLLGWKAPWTLEEGIRETVNKGAS